MTLDFHYQSANIVKYRTDVTFGWLDLMVSFGGIAGLFLGCSILSGAEFFYFFIVITLMIVKRLARKLETKLSSESNRVNIEQERKIRNFPKTSENVQVIKVQRLHDDNRKTKADSPNPTRY